MLKPNSKISNYTIILPIKEGSYADTYRVKNSSGKIFFLKLINYSKLDHSQFDNKGASLELSLAKQLHHPNLCHYCDSGEITLDGKKMSYIVYDFIVGETVAQNITREQCCTVYDAKQIAIGVLQGLQYLHSLPDPIIHNEITIQNVMIDMEHENRPILIDFGYARYLSGDKSSFLRKGLNPFFLAPECFNGVYTIQSDLYSVGTMLYHMIFGIPPFYIDLTKYKDDDAAISDILEAKRSQKLFVPSTSVIDFDDQILNTIAKAISSNPDDRFQSTEEFINALTEKKKIDVGLSLNKTKPQDKTQEIKIDKKKGNGLADVAGLDDLKQQIKSEVIDIIENPERAKKFGLTIPNGILLYGPPGCGKTYFAEKLAEEIGCNFISVSLSNYASPYIHGGQTAIANIFEKAKENTPTILFLDEIETMIRSREDIDNESMRGEVNEFLVQLNNCGRSGVIVIGATNDPIQIDEAALRPGRFDVKCYVPLPDIKAREALFRIELSKREVAANIDYALLAEDTENCSCVGISLIINNAAHLAFNENSDCITNQHLKQSIADTPSSIVSLSTIKKFEKMRDTFIGKHVKIGNGFADVAGLSDLKKQLQEDVINIIQDPKRAKKYNVQIPNGILLYGPPGCGKTFFAEKFAEECGYNFHMLRLSDLTDQYINSTEKKIAAAFEEARNNAPTVLLLEEAEKILMSRDKLNPQSNNDTLGGVNEFLSQLNNCGHDKVLVIVTTNNPTFIDKALLRAGRLERQYYVAPPDDEARLEFFNIQLSKHSHKDDIDVNSLVESTHNYSNADLDLLWRKIDTLIFNGELPSELSNDDLQSLVKDNKPSLTDSIIRDYMKIHEVMSGEAPERPRVGF